MSISFGRHIAQVGASSLLAITLGVGMAAGTASAAEKKVTPSVAVSVAATPSADGTLAYDITARNYGNGQAKYTNVVIPIDSSALAVESTTLSGTPSWLATSTSSLIEFRVEKLDEDQTATLHLVLQKLNDSASLSAPLSFTWNGGSGVSNAPLPYAPTYSLTTGGNGAMSVFESDIFSAGEPVTLWYNTPSGAVVPVEVVQNQNVVTPATGDDLSEDAVPYVIASDGSIRVQFSTVDLAAGTYTMVARGNWSGLTAVGTFQAH